MFASKVKYLPLPAHPEKALSLHGLISLLMNNVQGELELKKIKRRKKKKGEDWARRGSNISKKRGSRSRRNKRGGNKRNNGNRPE